MFGSEDDAARWAKEEMAELHRKADELSTRMASMLRRLEWAESEGNFRLCAVCGEFEPVPQFPKPNNGHLPTCDLHVLLKDLP